MLKTLLANPDAQGLVLAPTRELAQQISEFLQTLIPESKEFHSVRLVGGQDIRKQFKSLQRKPRLIVATPGRLIDHLKRNTVQIHKVAYLVLDEGDRMIDMGFAPQLEQILKHLPPHRQTAFFTATIDKKVTTLAQKYLRNPQHLMLDQSRPVAKIKQSVIQVDVKQKFDRILDELNARRGSVIIFLKTKRRTDQLTNHLSSYGYSVDRLHGGCSQSNRNKAISAFKDGKTRILCATDVAARGIDVPHVEHVINFDLPMMDEDYVHRVGRTGRNGASGEAVSFVTSHEHSAWNRLVKKYEIPESFIGSPKEARASGGKPKSGQDSRPPKKGHGKKRHFFKRKNAHSKAGARDNRW
jgi:superfamily II DNA/RNA helicase